MRGLRRAARFARSSFRSQIVSLSPTPSDLVLARRLRANLSWAIKRAQQSDRRCASAAPAAAVEASEADAPAVTTRQSADAQLRAPDA